MAQELKHHVADDEQSGHRDRAPIGEFKAAFFGLDDIDRRRGCGLPGKGVQPIAQDIVQAGVVAAAVWVLLSDVMPFPCFRA